MSIFSESATAAPAVTCLGSSVRTGTIASSSGSSTCRKTGGWIRTSLRNSPDSCAGRRPKKPCWSRMTRATTPRVDLTWPRRIPTCRTTTSFRSAEPIRTYSFPAYRSTRSAGMRWGSSTDISSTWPLASPHSICDTAVLTSLFRWQNLPRLLGDTTLAQRVVYASDWPFTSNALIFWNRLRPGQLLTLSSETNLFERDYQLKRQLGLPQEAFARGVRLLGGP